MPNAKKKSGEAAPWFLSADSILALTGHLFDLTLCRSEFAATIQYIFESQESARRAAAQAASDALDPFNFTVDLECEEPEPEQEAEDELEVGAAPESESEPERKPKPRD